VGAPPLPLDRWRSLTERAGLDLDLVLEAADAEPVRVTFRNGALRETRAAHARTSPLLRAPAEVLHRLGAGPIAADDLLQIRWSTEEGEEHVAPWSDPPVRGFRGVDLRVELIDPDRRITLGLGWRDGLLLPAEPSTGAHDLTIEGSYALAARYLTGAVWSDALFARARVRGDVFALSALHGLTHHPSVTDRWRLRAERTEAWLRFVDLVA
jgi:hypothetical protein